MPIPPLLVIPFIAYNVMALGVMHGGMGWSSPLVAFPLPSSETFLFTLGDALVLIALALLIVSPRLRSVGRTPLARAAMLAVPLAYAGEFLLVPAAATSLFFTCLAMSVAECLMEWRGARSER